MYTMETVPTPCYVVDEQKIKHNLEILAKVEKESGCHILLAQKAFSMFALYPLIGSYISGTTASGLYEARLGREEMGKENHVFAPAYKASDMKELTEICDHIIFNSLSQYETHRDDCRSANVSVGLRINPQCSTQEGHDIYDPCATGSRLGVTRDMLQEYADGKMQAQPVRYKSGEDVQSELFATGNIEGLHFHTLCEQNSDALVTTFAAFEEKWGDILHKVKWLNMGGGHHITREDYDRETLVALISRIRQQYGVEVYLEPGEAVALDAGYLVTEVMDKVRNDMEILILDASAACHMPDVLEMPYRPPLRGGYQPGEMAYTYRLSSMTCLAGDVIGDYSFKREVKTGDRLVFEDMAIYSMVKNNTFNGMPLPGIALLKENGDVQMIRTFGYEDFKMRLS